MMKQRVQCEKHDITKKYQILNYFYYELYFYIFQLKHSQLHLNYQLKQYKFLKNFDYLLNFHKNKVEAVNNILKKNI